MENERPSPQPERIPPQLLTEIIVKFGGRPDPTHEEWRFPLQDCRGIANSSGQDDQPFDVDIVDLGFRGAGFITDNIMEIGEIIRLGFDSSPSPHRLWPAKVVHTHVRDDGQYHVGVRFIKEIAQS